MSDQRANVEIEDVLSSIRRLVSDNEWSAQPAPHSVPEDVAEPDHFDPQPEKFVLTPALRVVEPSPAPVKEAPQEGSAMTELEQMIAELEQAVTKSEHQDWEPEGDNVEDLIDTPEPFPSLRSATIDDADVLTADLQGEPAVQDDDQVVASDDPDLSDLDGQIDEYLDGGALIDEDKLRQMVTEIVRSELQGALGERITRNVRKLVRREIYRVLSSQEFE